MSMKKQIKRSDVQFYTGYKLDPIGITFLWNDRFFRVIHKEKTEYVKAMFDCGLIKELIDKKYLVEMWICDDIVVEGYEGSMIIESRRIPYTILSNCYSAEMMRCAALLMTNMLPVMAKYGYELLDPNFSNVLFKGSHPYYVDLGSLVRMDDPDTQYRGVTSFYVTVLLRVKGRTARFPNHEVIEYFQTRNEEVPLNIFFGLMGVIGKLKNVEYKAAVIYGKLMQFRNVNKKITSQGKKGYILKIWQKLFGKKNTNYNKYKEFVMRKYREYGRELKRLKFPAASPWGSYQDDYGKDGKIPDRFRYVIEKVRRLGADNCLELAANQGLLSGMLIKEGAVKDAVCFDYDEVAISRGFLRARKDKDLRSHLYFGLVNFVSDRNRKKCQSDVVIALAVTHHLILTQKLTIEYITDILWEYTRKYLIVEFMPEGLWSERYTYQVPEWYTLDWFRSGLETRFKILSQEQLAYNRICLICEVRDEMI